MNGPILFVLLLAMALALPISFGLIKWYRWAVSRSMRRSSARSPIRDDQRNASTASTTETLRELSFVDAASSSPTETEATKFHGELLRAPWRIAAVYVLAGACYAVTEAVLSVVADEMEIAPVSLLTLSWIYFWPSVLTVNLVAAVSRRAKAACVVVYFLIFVGISTVAMSYSPEGVFWKLFVSWALLNLPATLLLLTFLNRRIRAVGPLVLIFMIIAVLGSQLMLSILTISDEVIRAFVSLVSIVGLGAYSVLFGLTVLGFFIVWPIGWLLLMIVRRLYEKKKISDQSITVDAIWLLFAVTISLLLGSKGTVWLIAGLGGFLVFKIVASLGLRLFTAKTPSPVEAPRLLVLRVFSLGKPGEKLFSALAKHWRHVGSMQLIAGPDLATSTLEPHEFLDFVSGKLARRFIDGPEALEKRTSEMDTKPDQDGRFRVNDFFCHDDTWKLVLSRLVKNSNAVIMDLRGFTADNEGCLYEINELINVASLKQVVFVIKTAADEKLLREQAVKSWRLMMPNSPNRSSAGGELRMFRFSRSGDLKQLLGALGNAVSSSSS